MANHKFCRAKSSFYQIKGGKEHGNSNEAGYAEIDTISKQQCLVM